MPSSMTGIKPPSAAVRGYLAGYGLGCIMVHPDGEVRVSQDWSRAGSVAAALWTRDRAAAYAVVQALGEQRPGSVVAAVTELMAASVRTGTILTPHEAVVERAEAAVKVLNARLASANAAGLLQAVNREFKRRRLAAERAGGRFMPYSVLQWRLRQALAGAAATGSLPDILATVFGS
jgi:hypothetical protein